MAPPKLHAADFVSEKLAQNGYLVLFLSCQTLRQLDARCASCLDPRRTNSLQRRCSFSGRIVRQTRAEFRPSNPEGSRGFESVPLRQAVPISPYSPLESPNSA